MWERCRMHPNAVEDTGSLVVVSLLYKYVNKEL